jgi:hypothetical protein
MLSRIVFRRWRREEQRYGAAIRSSKTWSTPTANAPAARFTMQSLCSDAAHSPMLARLVRSIRAYDVVLVGFMPFGLIWQVLAVARAFRSPSFSCAVSPEDLYHHFRVYYRCRRAAILAQTAYSAELFRGLPRGATGAGRARRR